MPIEVDESQFQALTQTANTLKAMLENPKTRTKVLEAFKENNPGVAVPELDAAAPVRGEVENLKQSITDFMKEFREDREREKTESKLSAVKRAQDKGRAMLKGRGYTDDGIKALESFRDDKGIVDYSDAIYLFERDHPAPTVAEPSAGGNFFQMVHAEASDDDFKKRLFESRGQDDGAVNRMAMDTISELRGSSSRR